MISDRDKFGLLSLDEKERLADEALEHRPTLQGNHDELSNYRPSLDSVFVIEDVRALLVRAQRIKRVADTVLKTGYQLIEQKGLNPLPQEDPQNLANLLSQETLYGRFLRWSREFGLTYDELGAIGKGPHYTHFVDSQKGPFYQQELALALRLPRLKEIDGGSKVLAERNERLHEFTLEYAQKSGLIVPSRMSFETTVPNLTVPRSRMDFTVPTSHPTEPFKVSLMFNNRPKQFGRPGFAYGFAVFDLQQRPSQ